MSALAAFVLALCAARPPAGDESHRFENGVGVRVWSPWPACVHRGWVPVYVELENASEREREVSLEATCNDWSAARELETSVRLAPGERVALELLLPLGADYSNDYSVLARSGEHDHRFGDAVGTNGMAPGMHPVLYLSETTPAAGEVERWSAELSTEVVEQQAYFVGRTSGTTPPNDIQLAHAAFAGMARHHAAYSSLDLVVLDTARGLPGEERLAALLAWVRTGGDLLLLGPRARAEAAGVPGLAAWMEPRFAEEQGDVDQYRCGLGRLFVGDLEADTGGPYADCVRAIVQDDAALVPKPGSWRGDGLVPRIPDLSRLPLRTFALLLFLFAVAIGPLNFVYIWRKRRPVLLLVTIPAIALVTTLALLGYGVFFQGLEVKTASYSVAVLDQREHRSACVETRQMFAGVAPAEGLALGPGTIVHYQVPQTRGFGPERFTIELDGDYLLAGDYLPSRRAVSQVLTVERAERARLALRRAGAGLALDNDLGAEVQELIVRDPEGRFFALAGALAAGGSASAEPLAESEAQTRVAGILASSLPPSVVRQEAVPPGCYLARLATGPFRDACGLETHELAGAHVVLGVLSLAPEDWR